jgi:hypothetical protein
MRFVLVPAALALVLGGGPGPAEARGDIALTLANGRVTLVAHNATPRQILEEWARRGHTRIVNVERVAGGPDTLLLTNEPESKALAILLQTVSGYIAAPRRVPMANASIYDRILIMPRSSGAPAAAFRPMPMAPPPGQEPAIFEVPPDPSELANEEPGVAPAPPVFQGDPNGAPQPTPPNPSPNNGVSPYVPPPDPNAEPAPPPALPGPGQQTAPQPGVLPVPTPAPQQQPR